LDPWNALLGKPAARALFSELARGLSTPSQVHALFSTYELNPELFERRLEALSPRVRRRLGSALAIAREYAIFRERAFLDNREDEDLGLGEQAEECELLRRIPPEVRLEAREWIGFWTQYRQGHWSGLEIVERGVRTHVNFDSSEFFARLLATRPRAFALVHNHPSGMTAPSWVDYRLTERIAGMARQFGIELKGHWIVGPHSEDWIPADFSRREFQEKTRDSFLSTVPKAD
jgi:hypothetical protein